MKIVYFTHYFPPAGFAASVNTYEIVKELAKKGHEVHVFGQPTFSKYTVAPSKHDIEWPENLKVHFSIQTPLSLSVAVPHILNVFKSMRHEYNFDVVITQFHAFHLASLSGYLAKIFAGKPWIVKVHDIIVDPSLPMPFLEKTFIRLWYSTFMAKLGKKANKLFVLTSELRRFLERNGFSPSQVAVVPNGVDTKLFSPRVSKKVPDSGKMILYIGSMTWDDGLDRLIKAFSRVDFSSDPKLVLIGDGQERPHLMELTKKLRLEKRVVFRRYVSHELIPSFISASYLTVGPLTPTPIIHYTIPTKILEYFACGKTTVSCRVSRDVLIPWETGLVVEKSNPESISESLSILLNDEKLTMKMGKKARLLVEKKYDWSRVMDMFEKEIKMV